MRCPDKTLACFTTESLFLGCPCLLKTSMEQHFKLRLFWANIRMLRVRNRLDIANHSGIVCVLRSGGRSHLLCLAE